MIDILGSLLRTVLSTNQNREWRVTVSTDKEDETILM